MYLTTLQVVQMLTPT